LDDSYQIMEDSTAVHKQIQRLRATIGCLGLLLVGAVTAILFLTFHSSPQCTYDLVGPEPTDANGKLIPQVLASQAQSERQNVMISGSWWEPMQVLPGRELSKGSLDPKTTAFVIIDMQPLFYDESSPWGSPDGLDGSPMSNIWQKQLKLGQQVGSFTGRPDSVFFTRYVVPEYPSESQGIMRHYYGMQPGWANEKGATKDALDVAGLNSTHLLLVMPQLSPLIESGAQVSTKTTGGAMGPGSTLPAQLDAYFEATGAGNATRTLIVAGVETDYCVISTVLGAIDRYYRIILITDAIGSSQPNAAQAQLDYTLRRFDHMADLGTAADVGTLLN